MSTKGIAILLLGILIISCNPEPKIPISNTLEISLAGKYDNYVTLLNRSIEVDTLALKQFLSIDYIDNAAGYDHGAILVHLMENIGEESYLIALKSMNAQELNNIKSYFIAGIQGVRNDGLIEQYKRVFDYLGFTKEELQTLR